MSENSTILPIALKTVLRHWHSQAKYPEAMEHELTSVVDQVTTSCLNHFNQGGSPFGYLWEMKDGTIKFWKAPVDPEEALYSEPGIGSYNAFYSVYLSKPVSAPKEVTIQQAFEKVKSGEWSFDEFEKWCS